MKNTDIKYELSTDYENLFNLLKNNNVIFGVVAVEIENIVSTEFSKTITMWYNPKYNQFNLEFTTFWEEDIDKIGFLEICKEYNIRYFDLVSSVCKSCGKHPAEICDSCVSDIAQSCGDAAFDCR